MSELKTPEAHAGLLAQLAFRNTTKARAMADMLPTVRARDKAVRLALLDDLYEQAEKHGLTEVELRMFKWELDTKREKIEAGE